MLDGLNNKQREAVETVNGPFLVLAGAGSGKTKVLTTRVAYLIKEKNVRPENVLAITFTNKAANEMKERLSSLIGEDVFRLQVSTFHSFGLKIIRENTDKLGLLRNFTILDADDSLRMIKKILEEKNYVLSEVNPRRIRNRISSAKNEMISPEAFNKYVKEWEDEVVEEVYISYEAMLKKNHSVDFDDLLLKPLDLFMKNKEVLERYQEHYKYILIDEYQDTNEVQYQLTKLLAAKYRNICCVGDNDQSIYSFRGANFRNILNFEKDYPDATVIKLEQNYRSTKKILAAANSVIKNNKDRKDKNLWSDLEEGDPVAHFEASDHKGEVNFIADEISKLTNTYSYEDIAIIYRTNAQSRSIEDGLKFRGIPYRIIGGLSFYGRKEIKDLVAYLNLIYNENDDISLERVINEPKRGIGAKSIENLRKKARDEGISMYSALSTPKELEFKEIIELLKGEEEKLTLTQLVSLTLEASGIYKYYRDEDTLESRMRLENLDEFKTITKEFERNNGDNSLGEFLYNNALISDTVEGDKGVNLMTVHSIKGLEFPVVFIVGMEEGLLPHQNSLYNSDELEEERRLCYVAITRAMKKLYITSARSRLIFGRWIYPDQSRFLEEIDESLLDRPHKKTVSKKIINKENTYRDEEDAIDFNIGDLVFHENFGKGIIKSMSGDILVINFSFKYGTKKIAKNHKKLIKYREEI